MSKGHPYRYEHGHNERIRSRFGPHDARRGSPYKRQRRSSGGNDFTIFSYDDFGQEVGLGNFTDFSAISSDTVLVRESRCEEKPAISSKPSIASKATTALSIETTTTTTTTIPTSNISPLAIRISPTRPTTGKPPTTQKSNSLLSSFHRTEKHTPQQRVFNQPPQHRSTPRPVAPPRVETSNPAPAQNIHHSTSSEQPAQSTGLLIQATSVQTVPSYIRTTPVTPTKEEVYQPKVEAVSPSNSENEGEKHSDETPKEELLKHMEKVDKEIADVEKKITELKEKQKILEEELSQVIIEVVEVENGDVAEEKEEKIEMNGVEKDEKENNGTLHTPETKEKSLIERIYEENRRKAAEAHKQFANIGIPFPNALPLYNQPSDLPFYEENRRKAKAVQLKLVKYFQRKRREKHLKQRVLLEEYKVLEKKWVEKIEKLENNPKRKNKELRFRDFYEKVFPEIKKQREQTERFSRLGSRANWGLAARSEAEYNEILKDLTEKEAHEKHMRDLAVDPPPLLDEDQRKVRFINRNGLIKDLQVYVNERMMLNVWTDKEKEIFKEKYIQCPKDFGYIAKFLDNKSVKDCVLYYYRTKRTGKYKKLARKQSLKRKRLPPNPTVVPGKDEAAKSRILPPRPEEYHSESDLEEDEAYDEDSDGSEGSSMKGLISTTASMTQVVSITPTTPSQGTNRPEPVETPRWSKHEREIAIDGLRHHGRNWTAISQMVMTKTDAQCKNFYFNYKRKLDLESVVAQHNASKMQRQESEETMSASEVSDDGFDIHSEDKPPSVTKAKQNARETRSQAAEKRGEPTPGPSLRALRPQRGSRTKTVEGKSSVQARDRAGRDALNMPEFEQTEEHIELQPIADTVENPGSDELRIVVDDLGDGEDNTIPEEIAMDVPGPNEYPGGREVPVQSRGVVPVGTASDLVTTTPSSSAALQRSLPTTCPASPPFPLLIRDVPSVPKATLSEPNPNLHPPTGFPENRSHSPVRSPINIDNKKPVSVSPAGTSVYPGAPFRTILVDTPLRPPSPHTEALLDMTRTMMASGAGRSEGQQQRQENESEREKVKKIPRVPDPQLHQVEQSEAIRKFNRFSPCIPPDTRGQLQVRTQGFPPSSFHPGNPLMQFGPHVGPHGAYLPPEMFPIGPGYPVHPQYIDYLQRPGIDPEHLAAIPPFSARLMEEAAVHQALWQPYDARGIHFGHLPPYMITSEMNRLTPPDGIARRREGVGHEPSVSVPVTRCRSVETAVMYSRHPTPEHSPLSEMRPGVQQRSISLSDVHSMVQNVQEERRVSPFQVRPQSSPSPKEKLPDQVKSYEPFNVLLNAAAGAQPIRSVEEPTRSAQVEQPEKPQAHFTRQSCVVTNTSVIHGPSHESTRYGITTGRARKPPPLTPISGSKRVPSPELRYGELQASAMVKETSPRGHEMLHARAAEKLETRSSHVQQLVSPLFGHSLQQQQSQHHPSLQQRSQHPPSLQQQPHHPPPLVRSVPSSLPDRRMLSSLTEFMTCGCRRSNEPCKHQLYSQEVPYVHRSDHVPRLTSSRRDHEQTRHAVSAPPVATRESPSVDGSRAGTTLFRPWMESDNTRKDSAKTSKPIPSSSALLTSLLERSTEVSPRYPVITSGSYTNQLLPVRTSRVSEERRQTWNPAVSTTVPAKRMRPPYDPMEAKRHAGPPYPAVPYSVFPPGMPPASAGNVLPCDFPGMAYADPAMHFYQAARTPHPRGVPQPTSQARDFPTSMFEQHLMASAARYPLVTHGRVEPATVTTSSGSTRDPRWMTGDVTGSDVVSIDEASSHGDRSSDEDARHSNGETLSCESGAEGEADDTMAQSGRVVTGTSNTREPIPYNVSEFEDTRSGRDDVAKQYIINYPDKQPRQPTPTVVDEQRPERETSMVPSTGYGSTSPSDTTFLGLSDSSWGDDNVDNSESGSSRVRRARYSKRIISDDSTTEHTSDSQHVDGNRSSDEQVFGGNKGRVVTHGDVRTGEGSVAMASRVDSAKVDGGLEEVVRCKERDLVVVGGDDGDMVASSGSDLFTGRKEEDEGTSSEKEVDVVSGGVSDDVVSVEEGDDVVVSGRGDLVSDEEGDRVVGGRDDLVSGEGDLVSGEDGEGMVSSGGDLVSGENNLVSDVDGLVSGRNHLVSGEDGDSMVSSRGDLVCAENNVVSDVGDLVSGRKDLVRGESDLISGTNDPVSGEDDLVTVREDLVRGTDDLVSSDNEVVSGDDGLVSGRNVLGSGEGGVISGESDLVSGRDNLVSGEDHLVSGTEDLVSGEEDLVSCTGDVASGDGDLVGRGNEVRSDLVSDTDELVSGTDDLVSGKEDLISGTDNFVTGKNALVSGTDDHSSGETDLAGGESDLVSGKEDLVSGKEDLVSGTDDLVSGTDDLVSGTDELVSSEEGDDLAAGRYGDDMVSGNNIGMVSGEAGDQMIDGEAGEGMVSGSGMVSGEGDQVARAGKDDADVAGEEDGGVTRGHNETISKDDEDLVRNTDDGYEVVSGNEDNEVVSGSEGDQVVSDNEENVVLGGNQGDEVVSSGKADNDGYEVVSGEEENVMVSDEEGDKVVSGIHGVYDDNIDMEDNEAVCSGKQMLQDSEVGDGISRGIDDKGDVEEPDVETIGSREENEVVSSRGEVETVRDMTGDDEVMTGADSPSVTADDGVLDNLEDNEAVTNLKDSEWTMWENDDKQGNGGSQSFQVDAAEMEYSSYIPEGRVTSSGVEDTEGDAGILGITRSEIDEEEPMGVCDTADSNTAGNRGERDNEGMEEPLADSAGTQEDHKGVMVSDTELESNQEEENEAENYELHGQEADSQGVPSGGLMDREDNEAVLRDHDDTPVSAPVQSDEDTNMLEQSVGDVADTTNNEFMTVVSGSVQEPATDKNYKEDEQCVVSSAGQEEDDKRPVLTLAREVNSHVSDETERSTDNAEVSLVSGSDDLQYTTVSRSPSVSRTPSASRSPSEVVPSSSSRESLPEKHVDVCDNSEKRDDVCTSVFEKRDDVSTSISEKRDDVSTSVSEKRDDVSTSISEIRDDVSTSVSEERDDICTSVSEKHHDVCTSISEKRDDVVSTTNLTDRSPVMDEHRESQSPSSEVEPLRESALAVLPTVEEAPARDTEPVEFPEEPTTTNPDDRGLTVIPVKDWGESEVSGVCRDKVDSSSAFDEDHHRIERDNSEISGTDSDSLVGTSTTLRVSSSADMHVLPVSSTSDSEDAVFAEGPEDNLDDREPLEQLGNFEVTAEDIENISGNSPSGVTSAATERDKYDIAVEAISSCDEECPMSDLEEGEIAETPGQHDDLMLTSDHTIEYIPISPAGSDEGSNHSNTTFSEYERSYMSSAVLPSEPTSLSELTSTLRLSLSVPFPFSALNVRSTPNSNSSSPATLGFVSGCSTPVIFRHHDSNTPLSEHYEPLSDDENNEQDETNES